MAEGRADSVRDLARRNGIPFAGEVQIDRSVEPAIGDPQKLAATRAAADLRHALSEIRVL